MTEITNLPKSASRIRTWRQISQVIFLSLFIVLLYLTEFSFTSARNPDQANLPSPLLRIFFNIDPLSGIGMGLAAWVVDFGLLMGLIIIISSIFFGRFFCGWICPLGTINQACSKYIPQKKGFWHNLNKRIHLIFKTEKEDRQLKRQIEKNRYHKYQSWKYYILIGLLALATLGSLQTGLFDPITIAARSIGLVVIPALNLLITNIANLFGNSQIRIVSLIGKAIFQIGSGVFIYFKQPHFQGIIILAIIFVAILLANRVATRFWCRGLCPLGALLGLLSRYSIFGLYKNHSSCTNCNLCLTNCQGGDDPQGNVAHRRSECILCLNCKAACPENVIEFKFQHANIKQYKPKPDLILRRTVLAGVAGVAAYPILRSGDSFVREESYLRPPGSLIEEDFLKRCIRCGQCMKICPTNALQPALLESGIEGIFTPVLIPRIGYCEYSCVLCGQACPTGAITGLDLKTKIGDQDRPPVKIGTAFFDKGRCLPWASGVPCIVCEEWCPTSTKAIWLEEAEVTDRNGIKGILKLPHVDIDRCIGCGVCEKVCPISGKTGVYITSAGESRDPRKTLLLKKS
jgi:MauM/NapG family ferredoxin protein